MAFSDIIQAMFGTVSADDGKLKVNASYQYYRKYLYRIIYERFSFEIPETWDGDYFREALFCEGNLGVTDTEAGILALRCGVSGVNVFEHPTRLIFANPVLGSFERTIGLDGVHIHIRPDFMGMNDLVNRYAALLADCDSSIAINLNNTKISNINFVRDKKQAQELRKIYEDAYAGKPSVYVNNTVDKESIYYNPVRNSYICDLIHESRRAIMSDFLTAIGVNNTSYEKKERLVTDEVNVNNEMTELSILSIYESIKKGLDEANDMFGLDCHVYIRDFEKNHEKKEEGGKSDAVQDDDSTESGSTERSDDTSGGDNA